MSKAIARAEAAGRARLGELESAMPYGASRIGAIGFRQRERATRVGRTTNAIVHTAGTSS